MKIGLHFAAVAAVTIAVATVVACSSDDHPGVGSVETSSSGGVVPPDASARTSSEASAPLVDGGDTAHLCDVASEPTAGDAVEEITIKAATPPDPLGGSIAQGTYELTELEHYDPNASTGTPDDGDASAGGTSATPQQAKRTLVIAGNTYRLGDVSGDVGATLGALTYTGGTFTVDGTKIRLDQTCPTASSSTFGFTSGPATIALYAPTADRRETFTLQP